MEYMMSSTHDADVRINLIWILFTVSVNLQVIEKRVRSELPFMASEKHYNGYGQGWGQQTGTADLEPSIIWTRYLWRASNGTYLFHIENLSDYSVIRMAWIKFESVTNGVWIIEGLP